ncbi:MAG: hypothetical protein V7717_00210 [Porticoccaceae bacterium]
MGAVKKSKSPRFIGIPQHVAHSEEFAALKGNEVKLLIDLLVQYYGRNNGKLSPTLALMKKRGWASSSLYRAHTGLLKKGFVVVTRQGWKQRGRPTLVAITWNRIDECDIDYDEGIRSSATPLNSWRKKQ